MELLRRERELLGHEIHDGLVQHLIAAKMFLESANAASRDADSQDNGPLLDSAVRAINDALAEARLLLDGERLAQLDGGLPQAIEQEMQRRLEPFGIQAAFRCSPEKPIAPAIAQTVLRVAQECLSNIVRHGRATHAEVSLLFRERVLELTVSDNGVGTAEDSVDSSLVSAGSASQQTSFGIAGMRKRAAAFGGTFDVARSSQGGVRGHLVLPLQDPLAAREPKGDSSL
jgi:signal transduction histidine kinase